MGRKCEFLCEPFWQVRSYKKQTLGNLTSIIPIAAKFSHSVRTTFDGSEWLLLLFLYKTKIRFIKQVSNDFTTVK